WGDHMRCAFAIFLAAVIGGCAKSPGSIQPAYMSPVAYAGLSCNQLKKEAARVQHALTEASMQQEETSDNDAAGILLIGMPVASFSGENIATQIAALKGEIEAVQRASLEKKCA